MAARWTMNNYIFRERIHDSTWKCVVYAFANNNDVLKSMHRDRQRLPWKATENFTETVNCFTTQESSRSTNRFKAGRAAPRVTRSMTVRLITMNPLYHRCQKKKSNSATFRSINYTYGTYKRNELLSTLENFSFASHWKFSNKKKLFSLRHENNQSTQYIIFIISIMLYYRIHPNEEMQQ